MTPLLSARTREAIAVLLGVVTAVVLVHHPMFRGGLAFIQENEGDGRFNHALLEHSWLWLTREPANATLFDPPFFYPAKNILAYSDVMLGHAPLYWPLRLVGVRPDTAFQLWMMINTALNFVGAFFILRKSFTLSRLAAFFGGMLFAAAAVRTSYVGHIQLYLQLGTLAFVYGALQFFREDRTRRQRVGDAALTVVGFTVQLWSAFYLAWFLALGAALALIFALVLPLHRRRIVRVTREAWPILLASIVAVALLNVPVLLAYLSALKELGGGGRPLAQAVGSLARWYSYVNHGPYSWLYSGLWNASPEIRHLPLEHEHRLGIGFLTAVLAIAGFVVAWRRPSMRLAALVAIAILGLTLHLGDASPYRFVYAYFPGGQGIRAVSRIMVLVLLPLSFAFAFTLESIAKRTHVALALVLGVLCMVEQGVTTETYDKERSWEDVQRIARTLEPARCEAFLFESRNGRHEHWKYQIDGMWAALVSGVPTVNGYSGNSPPGWRMHHAIIGRPDEEMRLMRFLDEWAAQHAVERARICWPKLEPTDVARTASLDVPGAPTHAVVGRPVTLKVVALNTGTEAWDASKLGIAGIATEPRALETEPGTPQHGEIPRGGRVTFDVTFTPTTPGDHSMAFDLVGESRRIGWRSPVVQMKVATSP